MTPAKFIEVWENSDSADEVAEKLGMPKPIVHARASSYRQMGIKLKKMPRHSTRGLDVQGLNDLIDEIRKNDNEEGESS